MNTKTYSQLLSATLPALILFAVPAQSQNRPECIADLMTPGACFEDAVVGEVFIGCNLPGESDVVEGILVWEDVGTGVNDFDRINPDGTRFAHSSAKDLETIYCPWDTVFAGLCTPDSAAPEWLYYGTSNFKTDGLFAEFGVPSCPFVLTSRGQVTRPVDGDTIEINAMVKYVPDPGSPTGCRLHTCRIFKPGKSE
jgi:hypothetical protein